MDGTQDGIDFLIDREDLRRTRVTHSPATVLEPGELRLRIDSFALTSNNVTYAVLGDAIRYWDFFPAPSGWGRVPVWGLGDVIESRHDVIAAGERLFGYVPMSTHLNVRPTRVTAAGLVDGMAHRAALPPAYNYYARVSGRDDDGEALQALLRPLFMASFLVEDFLEDNQMFGARSVLLSSASSKTALGLAFLLSRRASLRCDVVGLTSPRNGPFVESVGYFDRVVTYDTIETLSRDATAFVDLAGNATVLHRVHQHLGDALTYSCLVGATHWGERAPVEALPGPKPVFFFVPDQMRKRSRDWGPGAVETRFDDAWRPFVTSAAHWLHIVEGHGRETVERAYRAVVDGDVKPDEGHVLSLWPR